MKEIYLLEGPLLNEEGNLAQAGYAFELIKQYERKAIKANKSRIKEWDYYYIGDDQYGIALTIDDNSYMGLLSASILDFNNKKYKNNAKIFWFPFGKVGMPESSKEGNIKCQKGRYSFEFINQNGERHLIVDIKKYSKDKDFHADVILKPTTRHSMVIATPFRKDKHFYYNQKINNLSVQGSFSLGSFSYHFKDTARAVLDWGRGVWTYQNTWYWSSLNSFDNGHNIGFNLGYGFGDTTKASENMFFYDDKVFKFSDVEFFIPKINNKDDFMSPWKILSKDKSIDLVFTPILNRKDYTNALIISQDANQVFGSFKGAFKTEDKTYYINDLLGFAEKVKNKW